MNKIKGLVIKPNGEDEFVTVGGNDASMLRTLQEVVGGYIEAITGDTWVMYCNEEGKLLGLPPNIPATTLLDRLVPGGFSQHDIIMGTVIILGTDTKGYETDVPEKVLATYGGDR